MSKDDILFELEFERAIEMDDDILSGYRQHQGAYRLGSLDMDPESAHFEEMMDLAWSLRG